MLDLSSIKINLKFIQATIFKDSIHFIWPGPFLTSGDWKIIDRNGTALKQGSYHLDDLDSKKISGNVLYSLNAFPIKSFENLSSNSNGFFRFCLSSSKQSNSIMFCSAYYKLIQNNDGKSLKSFRTKKRSFFTVNGKKISNTARIALSKTKKYQIHVLSKFGTELSFNIDGFNPKVFDFWWDKEQNKLFFIIEDFDLIKSKSDFDYALVKPYQYFIDGGKDFYSSYFRLKKISFNYNEQAEFSYSNSIGLPLIQRVIVEDERKLIDKKQIELISTTSSDKATYNANRVIQLDSNFNGEVLSKNEENIDSVHFEDKKLKINAMNLKKGELNFLKLDFKKKAQHFSGVYEIYRGHQHNVTLLGKASADTSGMSVWMNSTYDYWLEDLWPFTGAGIFHQRLGFFGQYYHSFIQNSRSWNFDIKYRFQPGLFEVHPTWGLVAGVWNVYHIRTDKRVFGLGLFYSRPLPKFFAWTLEWIPWFRYPKWMFLEYKHYFYSFRETDQLGLSGSFRFSGRVFYTEQLFLQAGWEVKSLLINNPNEYSLSYRFLSANLGLGWSF